MSTVLARKDLTGALEAKIAGLYSAREVKYSWGDTRSTLPFCCYEDRFGVCDDE